MNQVYNTEPHTNPVDTLEEMADIIRNKRWDTATAVSDIQIWEYHGQWFASIYFEVGEG